MMVSALIDVPIQVEGEIELDRMAQRVQNCLKFKYFYDQMVEAGHNEVCYRAHVLFMDFCIKYYSRYGISALLLKTEWNYDYIRKVK